MVGSAPPRLSDWRLILAALVAAFMMVDALLAGQEMGGASDDFVPQWVLPHLAATLRSADAYDFDTQAEFMREYGFPPHRLSGLDEPHMKGIGVCPYPPTYAVLFAPLGALPFDAAALVVYFGSIALVLIAAWVIADTVDGRPIGLAAAIALPFHHQVQFLLLFGQESWPVMTLTSIALALAAAWAFGRMAGRTAGTLLATIAVLSYPGVENVLHLGQNSLLTLALLALGWRGLVRRHDLAAGLWWGLLAYKVHWLLAVGWVPLVIRRPRVLLGMAVSAGALALAATALLGPAAWGRWLAQVSAIDRVYALNPEFREGLLFLGCDLRSIAIRYLPLGVGRYAGWAAMAAVAAVTAVWYRRQPAADPAGPEGAALVFAVGLTAAHLYYYDETVFLLPLLVSWSFRRALAWWQVTALVGLTVVYYIALRLLFAVARPADWPPIWTLVVVALWALALTVKTEGSHPCPCASTTR